MRRISFFLFLLFVGCRLTPAYAQATFNTNKIALVIGVQNYMSVSPLNVTNSDAMAFAGLLQTRFGFQPDNIRLMTDAPGMPSEDKPTLVNLINATDELIRKVDSNSEVVFYYSGHGTSYNNQDYIIPLDGSAANIERTGISYTQLKNSLSNKLPRRTLLVVDACRSLGGKDINSSNFGAVTTKETGSFGGGRRKNRTASVGIQGGNIPQFAEFLSCQPTEISLEGDKNDFKASVFTHFLIRGFNGEAVSPLQPAVTFDSLNQYVHLQVSQYADRKLHRIQNPEGRTSLGSMVLIQLDSPGTAFIPTLGVQPQASRAPFLPPGFAPIARSVKLQVQTIPFGADVYVDGNLRGTTSATACEVEVNLDGETTKNVEVTVRRDGFQTAKQTVTVTQGQATPPVVMFLKGLSVAPPAPLFPRAAPLPPDLVPLAGVAGGTQKINSKDGAEMVWVPSGSFLMGSSDDDMQAQSIEKPQRLVSLTGYWMYRNMVTVGQYKKFCAATRNKMPRQPSWGWQDNHPIVNVTWDDAKEYCDWAGVRLPSQSEWEKAARGTDGRVYPWGSNFNENYLWSNEASGGKMTTVPVGSFPGGASPYGCLDMAGNAWQWCSDYANANYVSISPRSKSKNSATELRVVRGGSWGNSANTLRSANCNSADPTRPEPTIGFRCAANP